jgi:hypothetical protein
MAKRILLVALIAAGVAVAAGAARLFLGPKTGSTTATGVPTIGGDTWPPVPVNPGYRD